MSPLFVLSHFQAAAILGARQSGVSKFVTSTDLGRSSVEVNLDREGDLFPGGKVLSWRSLEEISLNENGCYLVTESALTLIRKYSGQTEQFYSLMPTESAPTMLISGIPMHRIKGTNPYLDTLSKIKALRPIGGQVLDTATGLGYTALEAAKTASLVVTIEIDPAAQEIARLNPWSQALFENPKIAQLIGNSMDEIKKLEGGRFTCIIHDPPTVTLAGEL